jgi:hypothetical protein
MFLAFAECERQFHEECRGGGGDGGNSISRISRRGLKKATTANIFKLGDLFDRKTIFVKHRIVHTNHSATSFLKWKLCCNKKNQL